MSAQPAVGSRMTAASLRVATELLRLAVSERRSLKATDLGELLKEGEVLQQVDLSQERIEDAEKTGFPL